MATDTAPPPEAPERAGSKEEQPYVELGENRHTGWSAARRHRRLDGCSTRFLKGNNTLALGLQDTTDFHEWLNGIRDWVQLHGPDNWFFGGVLGFIGGPVQQRLRVPAEAGQHPRLPSPGAPDRLARRHRDRGLDRLGGRGRALRRPRSCVSMLFFGIFGLWQDSIDLLLVTLLAVAVCIIIGLPLGIAMARSNKVSAVITPFLDIAQTLPPFAYLAPIALCFGIGLTTAIVLTVIYALPPLVRITEHGIRTVPDTTIEAARSMGLTSRQMLRQVQLPMAKRTIVVGINQSMMAALSMATIAALVNGPGLGKPVNAALQIQNIGAASVAGLLIVLMAIMLDRTTTAASERSESMGRANVASVSGPGVMLKGVVLEKLPRWATEDAGKGIRQPRLTNAGRWLVRALWLVPVLIAVYISRTQLNFAQFPDREVWPFLKPIDGTSVTKYINDFSNWFIDKVDTFTLALKNDVTEWMINPFQDLLAQSPWWVMGLVILALAYVLGGWRPAGPTVICLAIIYGTGLWNDSMITLAMTLIATLLVMVVAVVLGVAMGRSRRADTFIRPFLDAFQTIPAVRLPGPGPGPVRGRSVHRDRGRPGLCRPDRDQAGRRRDPRSRAHDRRGGAIQRQHDLADDHEGPAAHGSRVARAGHQPGPALRAVHGRHRRPRGRRQPRLHRGLGILPGPAFRQGPRGRYRHHRPGRDARPDCQVRSSARRALTHHHRRLRGRTAEQSKRRNKMARGLTRGRTRLVAIVASVGLALAGLAACGSGGEIKDAEGAAAARTVVTSGSRSTHGPGTSPTPTSSATWPRPSWGATSPTRT